MSKLTLSVDADVVERAKEYAAERGTSVSQLVEEYFSLLTRPRHGRSRTPVLDHLKGCLKGTDPKTYRRHLEGKYE